MHAGDLKQLVLDTFGPGLERLDGDTLRTFVDRVQLQLTAQTPGWPVELNESEASYDEVMRSFFLRSFDLEREVAFVLLWLTAFEAWANAYLEAAEPYAD